MRCFQSPMAVDTNRVGDALLSPGIKGPQKSGRGPFTLLRLQKKRTQVFSSLPQTHFKKSGQKSKTSFKSPAFSSPPFNKSQDLLSSACHVRRASPIGPALKCGTWKIRKREVRP